MLKYLIPKDDPKQALRIRRFFIATASYLMWMILVVYCYYSGFIRPSKVWTALAFGVIVLVNILLYTVFRSGLNKRFSDPSLTMLQMITAALFAMVAIYFTDEIRGMMLLAYIVTILFGIFRLTLNQYIRFTLFSVATYAVVILMLVYNYPDKINIQIELLQFIIFASVLTWFSMVGNYLSGLREKLSVTNYNLKTAIKTIQDLAIHDDLTQAYNRRHMYEELLREKALADRAGTIFSIALIDLDHFKQVNDTYGHLKGDDVLKHLIHSINREIREIDSISRYGGEEFLIIMGNTDIKGAEEGALRIKKTVENLKFPGFPDSFALTISTGITTYKPVETIEQIIDRADKAMYKAKTAGRNKVIIEYT